MQIHDMLQKVYTSVQHQICAFNDHNRLAFFSGLIISVIEACKEKYFAVANDKNHGFELQMVGCMLRDEKNSKWILQAEKGGKVRGVGQVDLLIPGNRLLSFLYCSPFCLLISAIRFPSQGQPTAACTSHQYSPDLRSQSTM